MPYSHHLAERTLNLFERKPFLVFFRVLVLTWAVMQQEFQYIIVFIIGASIWTIESIALYIDPKLANHPLIKLANFMFLLLVFLIAIIHFAPDIRLVADFLHFN